MLLQPAAGTLPREIADIRALEQFKVGWGGGVRWGIGGLGCGVGVGWGSMRRSACALLSSNSCCTGLPARPYGPARGVRWGSPLGCLRHGLHCAVPLLPIHRSPPSSTQVEHNVLSGSIPPEYGTMPALVGRRGGMFRSQGAPMIDCRAKAGATHNAA